MAYLLWKDRKERKDRKIRQAENRHILIETEVPVFCFTEGI